MERKVKLAHEHRLVIGDWSDDGHNQKEYFTFKCTHDEKAVKKAYKDAVKKCKVSLHDDIRGAKPVCCKYQESCIEAPEIKALEKLGVNFDFTSSEFDDTLPCCPEDIACLFFEMVKTQIPDLEYKLVEEKKTLNGFWSSDFNFQFGYGCFP